MPRFLTALSLAAFLAAPAAAQCFSTADVGTPTGIVGDDAISGHVALGFTYPNLFGAAVLTGGYTHVQVCTNGWAMLTDGFTSTGLPAAGSYGSLADTPAGLGGGALGQPLLMPWWGDGNLYPLNSPVGTHMQPGVYVKAGAVGVPAEITWINHSDFGGAATKKSFKALIYPNGDIEYQYSKSHVQTGVAPRYVGVSARNGVLLAPPPSDLSLTGATTGKILYETFPPSPFDLASYSILFVPNLIAGGWTQTVSCTGSGVGPAPAAITVGTGCYAPSPMTLSVDLPPGLGISGETFPMTWTVTNVPALFFATRACYLAFSIFPPFVPGVDLGFIGDPDFPGANCCSAYIVSMDAVVDISSNPNTTGICPSPAWVFMPPPSLIGVVLTTQAFALAPAGIYNGCDNDIGGGLSLWTSNAIQQTYQQL